MARPRYYIGLATTFHDPALAIVGPDGTVRFAEAAERYLQYKRAPNCEPDLSMRMSALLREYCDPEAEYVVATSWGERFMQTLAKLDARGDVGLDAALAAEPTLNAAMIPADADKAFQMQLLVRQRAAGLGTFLGLKEAFGHTRMTLRRYGHHRCHAAYACFTSPFAEAACAVIDGFGEWGSMALYRYAGGAIEEIREHRGWESIGYYYGLMTEICGFDQVRGEEWKVMGLAPYGDEDPELIELVRRLYTVEGNRVAFAKASTIRETVAALKAAADPDPLNNANLARAAQVGFIDMAAAVLDELAETDGSPNLAYAGGCALNSSFNGRIVGRTGFERLYVPSAPADDGNALGAALLAYAEDHPDWRPEPGFASPYLGTPMSAAPVERVIEGTADGAKVRHLPGGAVAEQAAHMLAAGKVIGWAQGRAEFGPRALGNRSILADARPADAKDRVNAKVKLREPFRPFAPSILAEHGPDWFEDYQESPYMERTLRFRPEVRSRVPGVVHADGTGRLQTVKAEWNPRYHALVEAFHRETGVPLVLNTSFNIMGKPIVHSAEDAIVMLHTTGLDAVIVGDYLLEK